MYYFLCVLLGNGCATAQGGCLGGARATEEGFISRL